MEAALRNRTHAVQKWLQLSVGFGDRHLEYALTVERIDDRQRLSCRLPLAVDKVLQRDGLCRRDGHRVPDIGEVADSHRACRVAVDGGRGRGRIGRRGAIADTHMRRNAGDALHPAGFAVSSLSVVPAEADTHASLLSASTR